MKKPVFTGSATALVTPFTDRGVDYDRLAAALDRQAEGGTAAVVVCGTTGEAATLSEAERASIIEFTAVYTRSRMKVIAGIGGNDTLAAANAARRAERLGVDALLLTTPFYNKASSEGIVRHFAYVAESEPVSDDWFDDACFIGHSQIVGMQKYSGLSGPDYYAVVGHTAQAVVDYEFYELPDGRYGTLSDALHAKSYGKVYIMLGINDSSLRDDRVERFMNPMRTILDLVKGTQPGAKIYLLSLVPVGRYTPMNELYNPDSTVFYSQLVKTLSREYDTEYIDLFRMMCDKAGYFLNSFNSGDGIHIQSDRYPEIVEYLKRHT